jgi:uncharacterized Tic20 family protein
MLEMNRNVAFPAAPLLTVILALVGMYSIVAFPAAPLLTVILALVGMYSIDVSVPSPDDSD